MQKNNNRIGRIEEEMKKELSQIISLKLKNPDVKGMVSVIKVKVTTDLKFAKIYVSVLNANAEKTVAGLNKSSGFLRSEIAKTINLRNTPELEFLVDDSLEYGAKIDSILKEIIKDDKKEN